MPLLEDKLNNEQKKDLVEVEISYVKAILEVSRQESKQDIEQLLKPIQDTINAIANRLDAIALTIEKYKQDKIQQ